MRLTEYPSGSFMEMIIVVGSVFGIILGAVILLSPLAIAIAIYQIRKEGKNE